MTGKVLLFLLAATVYASSASLAQTRSSEEVQVNPPIVRRAEAPTAGASVAELELRGDTLRSEKAYLDALDYYRAAIVKQPKNAKLYNKIGINELQMARFNEARKDFEQAIKNDREFADAYNNLGVINYLQKKYGKAIKEYERAIKIRQDSGSFYSNLGAAYFSKKDFEKGDPGV